MQPVKAAPKLATALDVVINEVAWAGTQQSMFDEWIELYSSSAVPIDLTGWRIEAADGDPSILISGVSIGGASGNYLVLKRGSQNILNVPGVVYSSSLLDDNGETLYLLDDLSNVIDTVNGDGGGWPAGISALPKNSMERYLPSTENDFDWASFNGTPTVLDAGGKDVYGTPGYANSVSATTPPTYTSITSISPEPSGVNRSVTVTVKVDGILPAPTGTVTVDGVETNCTIISLVNGVGSCALTFATAGSKTISATYNGDASHATSTSLSKTHTVVPISPTSTTITLVTPEPSGVNKPVDVYVTVSNSSTPTGTVSVTSSDSGVSCVITLSSGSGKCSLTFTSVGNKTISAAYGGDSIHASSNSANVVHQVTTVSATTTTILSLSPEPSSTGKPVVVTVEVTGGVDPTGTIIISGASTNCTITLTVASLGKGYCTAYFTSAKAYSVVASYSGDSINDPSTSVPVTHNVLIPTPIPTRTPYVYKTPVPPPAPPPPLIAISEFVPRPGHDWNQDGVINTGDEYIEIINFGVIPVNLGGYFLDDEANIGSSPYSLPSITLQPGKRIVFYGSETGLLLNDSGDGVRLLKSGGQLVDAYNYTIAEYPDQTYCRLPDNGGLDDWSKKCAPSPGLRNKPGTGLAPDDSSGSLCPISDSLPEGFVLAECPSIGNTWSRYYWDQDGWMNDITLPNLEGQWDAFVD